MATAHDHVLVAGGRLGRVGAEVLDPRTGLRASRSSSVGRAMARLTHEPRDSRALGVNADRSSI